MVRLLFLTFCIFTTTLNAQSFIDNFDDADISDWTGDISSFTVNGSGQLQLAGDCTSGGTNYISIEAPTNDTAVWRFFVDLTFDPSSSNTTRIYLQSDNAILSGPLNGYYLRIGEDGTSDAVKLYRQTGETSTLLISGTIGEAAISPTLGIQVVKTSDAEWQLFIDASGGIDYVAEGSVIDDTFIGGNYFGLFCNYTSTRCDDFYFDQIFIDPLYTDIDAPLVTMVDVISSTQLTVIFNESITTSSSELITHYEVDGGLGNPISAELSETNAKEVLLTFDSNFPNGSPLFLTVFGIQDLSGNTIGIDGISFTYYTITPYDLLITEILADPEPQVALPIVEYIELYNSTSIEINLEGFTFTDGSSTTDPFPVFIMPANSYSIITNIDDASLFISYGTVLGINGFPSLNNDGDFLQLLNNEGSLIHNVNYNSSWYQNVIKEDGGYALEMIDPNNACQGASNWIASQNENGGTPAAINSVFADNPDEIAPMVISAFPKAFDTLIVYFDEPIDIATTLPSFFTIDNSIGNADAIFIDPVSANKVILHVSNSFINGIVYTLTCTGIKDCSNNAIGLGATFQFGMPEPALPFDIVINEIVFNPLTDGSDYVELYNKSTKIINLADLLITEINSDDTTEISEFVAVSNEGKLIFPGNYFIISSNTNQVAQDYRILDIQNFIEQSAFPNFPDDEGIVALKNTALLDIDRLHFYNDWHFALLEDENGVALERLNYATKTQDQNNWHSAAEQANYGTPGYQNSVFGGASLSEAIIHLQYTIVSPDGDGYQDVLIVNYNTASAGYVANFKVFDVEGRLIKQLTNNETLSREGFITWDGVNENNDAASAGIYILFVELFNLNGSIEKHKLKFTLAKRNN